MITENSIISSFNLLLDCGTIEPEDMKTVQNIIMNGRKKELEKIFKEAGCPELLKFTYCPSDERYKLRIPVSIKNKYDLKPAYKARSEEDIINALFNDIHKVHMMSITLDGLYELWKPAMIEKTRQRDRSMHTAAKHIEAYEALVKGTAFGAKIFRTIRHDDFDDFYCTCEGMHITKSRANEIKTTLNKIWEFGKAKGLVEVNHSKEFSISEYRFQPKKAKAVKTPEEREKLIAYYLDLDTVYGYACALMECLNLRVSEIKALKWSDIYLEDGLILVSHMVDHDGKYCDYTKNHDDEGSHYVPLSPRALKILMIIKEKNYNFRDEFVFLGKTGNFILTQECNNNIQAACKALGFQKKFSTHDCRRYAATQAALSGMSTPAMQKAFGWKDRDTAEKYVQVAAATREHEEMLVNVLN